MSEEELNNMFDNPEITKRANLKPPIGIVAQEENARGFWIVLQIVAWLKHWKGRQYARVFKINTWSDQQTNIDILVGYSGKYEKFKVATSRIANDMIVLKIAKPSDKGDAQMNGDENTFYKEQWNAIGVEIKDSEESGEMYIETAPKGERGSRRHALKSY